MMLNGRKYKQIVNEWFARLEKGYAQPPYSKAELQVLGPILKRNNIHKSPFLLEADGINQPAETVTADEYNDLIKKIENAADKYARYLTVFHYFAPDSLGTISEILLSKLLGGTHTGGSQGLTDLKVGNINISLKTTAAGKPILLGSKDNTVMSDLELEVAKKYVQTYGTTYTLGELIQMAKKSDDSNDIKAFNRIEFRLNAIAEKLAGADNNEYFIWASKNYSRGILSKIILYIKKFDKAAVIRDLKNGYLSVSRGGSGGAWGVNSSSGRAIVTADARAKYLNVTPEYVKSQITDTQEIDLLDFNISDNETGVERISDRAKTLINQLQSKANDAFFKYLDAMYDEIIKRDTQK